MWESCQPSAERAEYAEAKQALRDWQSSRAQDNEIYDFLEELEHGPLGEFDLDSEAYMDHIAQTAKRLLANRVIDTDNQLAKATLYHEEPCCEGGD